MLKAIWNNAVIAEAPADLCQTVEGNTYFPPDAVNREYLRDSDTHSTCGWKGECSYYSLAVGDQINLDAAWYYPDAKPEAKHIESFVAFWKGVSVET
jgi:uncharacterized protein (DUF427 family)